MTNLLDGVHLVLGGDLQLGAGVTGDLDNHVVGASGGISNKGDIVEGGNLLSVLLEEDTVLQSIRRSNNSGLEISHGRKSSGLEKGLLTNKRRRRRKKRQERAGEKASRPRHRQTTTVQKSALKKSDFDYGNLIRFCD